MCRTLLMLTLLSCMAGICFGQEYTTARAARVDAAKHLRARNYAAAQKPLEAALKLTPEEDFKERVQLYRALMSVYRVLNEIDRMVEAVEYIQDHSESQSERSIVARDYVSFLHQRGKTDFAVDRYESRLKKNPKDPTGLAVLSMIYQRLIREKKDRGEKLKGELKTLNLERAVAKSEQLEKTADAVPGAAASNWKDVAKSWLEAENKEKAGAALEKSLKSDPEARSEILTMFWRQGLGDVYAEIGEPARAIEQYEKAIASISSEPLKKPLRDKIEKLKKEAK